MIINAITWLNSNQGFASIILSITSLLFAGLAIWISISTNRKQIKLQLLNERYEIFERFSTLIEIMKTILHEAFTYKGFLMIANTQFYLSQDKNQNDHSFSDHLFNSCGRKVLNCNDKLEQLAKDSEEYKAIIKERDIAISDNFFELNNIYEQDKRLLIKSRLFFPDEAASKIAEFLAFYKMFVLILNYSSEEDIQKVIVTGRELLKEIEEAKTITIMDEYLDFTRK